MMILDKYVLRRFCLALFYAILPFVLIVIFVDMIGNLGKFIDKDVPRDVVMQYYLYYVPQILILAFPIAMLLASLFSLGYMARHNELTAIKCAGISTYRILAPVFILSFMVSFLVLGFGEKVVPPANQSRRDIETTYLDPFGTRSRSLENNLYLRDRENRRIFISQFDLDRELAQKVTIQKYDDNQIVERVDAPRMQWRDSTWVLTDGYKRVFTDEREIATPFDTLYDHALDITPERITQFKVEPEDMSYDELSKFVAELKRNGSDPNRWLVDLHFKLSLPFANFIMVLFGAPLAAHKNRSGAIFGFMMSLFICFIYYGFSRLIQTLGQNGQLAPPLAAWFTNGVFLIAGIVLLIYTRK